MNKSPDTIHQTLSIYDTLNLLGKVNKTSLPVVKKGKFIGIVQLNNCTEAISNGLALTDPISIIMNNSFTIVDSDFSMEKLTDIPIYVVDEEEKLQGEVNKAELFFYYQAVKEELKQKKELIKWFEISFDTAYEGVTVVDSNGVIKLFNDTYSRFVGVSKEEAIGQLAAKVIDNTRLPMVLETGVPERSQAHRLQGQNLVVHRLPIWEDNKVIGAVGMLVYEGVSEIYQVIERMELLDGTKRHPKDMLNVSYNPNEKKVRFEDILGESHSISKTKKVARKAANSKATVLITGESGVGKEQFARAIHDMGVTKHGNFVSVNCAAIPDNLLESELFGYAKGAFTGATMSGKVGKFELADQGTLFLDEIGDMPMAMQVKILRVIQEREIERVGSTTLIPVDFRLITATNKDLKQMVDIGEFREDLYYRLYVIPIHIPPLRDRKQDIPIIISHKMQQLARKYDGVAKTIDKDVLQLIYKYDWPGNIRELMNVFERLFVLSDEDHINLENVPSIFLADNSNDRHAPETLNKNRHKDTSNVHVKEEIDAIENALNQVNGNKTQAAKILGISRATLYNKLSRFSIDN